MVVGEQLPLQSSSNTVKRFSSTPLRPLSMEVRTSSILVREVAKTGACVVCKMCRVRANPIPREAGQTKHHAISYSVYGLIV